ncbi:hypothetical protein IWZ03DRAFT_392018 [Phyllosticta citriasiana]|uniref:Uncharacterized protein n=1 Tax=Phyllosticta citriasiana TaxID=595635 RepID=A0ABR1L0F1_9PEZI
MVEEFALYHYDPSTALAVVLMFLFSNESLAHGWLLWRQRTWYFIPFLIGGICKLILYIKSHQTGPLGPYVMQSLMILLAPILFAASIYMILGRIIRLVDAESYSPIRVGWLTEKFLRRKTSFRSSPRRQIKWGEHVIIAAGSFHFRIIRAPTQKAEAIWGLLRQYMLVLYAASFLIITLDALRVIEYVQGSDGELMSKEMWIYLFDATLTFLVMLLFVIWHPSRIINRSAVASNDVESANGSHSMVTFWKRGNVQR